MLEQEGLILEMTPFACEPLQVGLQQGVDSGGIEVQCSSKAEPSFCDQPALAVAGVD